MMWLTLGWLRQLVANFSVWEGEGAGNGGGSGDGAGDGDGGAGSGEGGKVDSAAAVAEMQAQMGVLTKAVTLMATGQSELQTSLRALGESIAAGPKKEEPKGGTPNTGLFDGVDLEQLDKAEFGTLLLTKFMDQLKGHMDGALNPVVERIKGLEGTVTSDMGNRQVAENLKTNPDLYEWKDELAGILKEMPNMKLSRALAIARSENPDKNKAMAKKYASAESKGGNVKYLSMTPTSRTAGSDPKGGRMKFNEAAERAFDDMLASLGATDFSQVSGAR